MAIELTHADHDAIGEYLNAVLVAYKDGKIDLLQARADLAHAMAAAALGSKGTFNTYIRIPPSKKWGNP